MQSLLTEIVAAAQERSGALSELDRLVGLSAEAIDALQDDFGHPFPDDVRQALAFYGSTQRDPEYDMVISIPHYGDMGLMSDQQIRATTALLRQRTGDAYWDPHWLPVTSSLRFEVETSLWSYDMVDLDPESTIQGTVFHWTVRTGRVRKLAPSFRAYLQDFRRALHDRTLRWDETYGFSY